MKALMMLLVLASTNLIFAQETCVKKEEACVKKQETCIVKIIAGVDKNSTNYTITFQAPSCDKAETPGFITCEAQPQIEVGNENICPMNPRGELANISLVGDIKVVRVQDFLTNLYPCEAPKVDYACVPADDLEQARYLMAHLGQFNSDLAEEGGAGRAPSIIVNFDQKGSLLVDERKEETPEEEEAKPKREVQRRPAVGANQE